MFKKIASNTISQVLSKAGTAIISIFLISLLTNFLTVEMYGLYSKVYNYTWIFVFLADLWLYAIAIREISANKKDSQKIVGNIMSLRLILWVVILFLSLLIAYFLPWYNSKIALISIFIASIFTIFQLLNSSIMALMQANMKIEFSLFSTVFWKFLNLVLVFLIVYFIFNIDYYKSSNITNDLPFIFIFLAWVIWVFINTLMNYFYASKIVKIRFEFDFDYIKHIFKISLPYWLALFLSVIYFKVDVILISLIEWPKMWDLSIALYSLPMKIIEVIMVVWGFYMTSVLPALTKCFKHDLKKDLKKLISFSFKILFSVSIFIFSLWILLRDYLIEIIANKDYLITPHQYNSSQAFLVVFAVVVFYFISLVFIYFLIASNNQNRLLKINIFVTLFNIIWNIILIPSFSFMWAWVVTLISQIILMILCWYYTKKIIDFKLPYTFIFENLIFWWIIYFVWNILLEYFKFGLYIDFLLYWFILSSIYSYFLYKTLKKEYKKIPDWINIWF